MAARPQARGSGKAATAGRGEEQLLPQVLWANSLQQGTCCAIPPEKTRLEPCRTDPKAHLGADKPIPTDDTCRLH